QECIPGAGGAGLFSDGKFSFYPSGTHIWKQDEELLRTAYSLLEIDLEPWDIPKFPDINDNYKCTADKEGWLLKPYPSAYLNLPKRIELIKKLMDRCPEVLYQTEYLGQSPTDLGYLVRLRNLRLGFDFFVHTKQIVLAGGRFMPLFLNCKKKFYRYEFGFRVVGPSHLIQKEVKLTDPKYIFDHDDVEYRTFCWCQDGEIIKTSFKGIESYSGRADCSPTGFSNYGFNIRIKSPSLLQETDFQHIIKMKTFDDGIQNFLKNSHRHFPDNAANLIEYGLNNLFKRFKNLLHANVRVIGPTIEGVGNYPILDEKFQVNGLKGVYVIGDSSGIYRGIVASMLAGYLLAVSENQKTNMKYSLKNITIEKV
nr:hypothetical protein [Parachlamydiaceae bacterium]